MAASDGTASSPASAPRFFVRVELLLGVVFWAVSGLVAAWRGALGAWLPYALVVGAAFGVWPLIRRRAWARTYVDWLPFPAALVTYDMLHGLAPLAWTWTIDPWLRDVDRGIFGCDLCDLTAPWTTPAVAWALSLSYAFYYVGPLGLGLWWWFRARRRAFREFMAATIGVLFVGYLGYLLLPAVGPQAHFEGEAFRTAIPGDWIGPVIRARNEGHGGNFPRDAFPSLHTANAVTLLLMAWRHERRVLWVLAPPMLGLIAATMLLRYHYAIDVAVGAALALAFQPVAVAWVRREQDWDGEA